FFFSSRRRHTSFSRDWSSVVCSSDLSSFLQCFLFCTAKRNNQAIKRHKFITIPMMGLQSLFDIFPVCNGILSGRWVCIDGIAIRSEEHTSELQSRENLVCRLRL